MFKKKLIELGVPANLKGFEMLNYAIQNYKPLLKTMKFYEDIGKSFNTTAYSAQRCILYAIKLSNDKDISASNFIAKYSFLWKE